MHLFHSNMYVFVFKNAEFFVVASKATGLEVNAVTATYMVMSCYQNAGQSHNLKNDNSSFERAGVYGQSANRRLSIPLGKHATVFQAEVYVILACANETEAQDQPEKYVSICSDSQAALKALQAAKATSPLIRQCQHALNNISARHAVRLYWVPGHAGVRGNETADRLARSGSCQQFIGPESFLGVSRQNIRKKMKRWKKNQQLALWRGPCSTQRQARELISGPNLATGA